MEEMDVKKSAIVVAKVIRFFMILIGLVMIVGPILFAIISGVRFETIKWTVILEALKTYIIPGFLLILVGEYMYYLLVTQAYLVYNSRRITDSSDVIESGVHRMAGLGYGQNVRTDMQAAGRPIVK